jgi:glycopeptide antibiotics resistance protein
VTTWLLEGEISIALFILLTPLLITPFMAWVYRKYRYPARRATILAAATGLYASAILSFTTFPLPETPQDFCTQRSASDYWRLTPGASFAEVADVYADIGLTGTLTSGTFLQVAFNVVFFIPLGFLVTYWWRRGVGTAAALGLGVSLLIETTQGSALWGVYPCPYRVAEVDDLITNTSGALIGALLGVLATRLLPYRDPSPRSDPGPPTVRRRLFAALLDLTVAAVTAFLADAALVIVELATGRNVQAAVPWFTGVTWLVAGLVFVAVPLVRDDRATPGQAAVLLALARPGAQRPAPWWSVPVRFVVRWAPIIIWGTPAIVVVLFLDGASVMLRSDRRSLTGLVSGTRTMTRDGLIGHPVSSDIPGRL